MVIISGFGRRGVMTVPAGFRGLVGRGLQEQSNLLHLWKLFVVVVVVEVAEEVVVEFAEEVVVEVVVEVVEEVVVEVVEGVVEEVVVEVVVEMVEEVVHSGGNVGKRSTFNQHPLSPDSAGWASK